MEECVESLLTLKDAISSTTEESSDHDSLRMFLDAYDNLLNSLISLSNLQRHTTLSIGQLVLAPRNYRGKLCQDLAIIVTITPESELQESFAKVIFLRPQTSYELRSHGSSYPVSQLCLDGSAYYQKQVANLLNLRVGDELLVKRADTNIWARAALCKYLDQTNEVIVKLTHEEDDMTHRSYSSNYLLPSCSSSSSFSSSSSNSNVNCVKLTVANSIESICPLPTSYIRHKHQLEHNGVEDSRDYDADIADNAPLYDAPITVNFEQMMGFGDWEKHTKGIGTKLMLKMGYKRGTGLGALSQGILAPVTGLLKALPSGMSLDYISEHRRQAESTDTLKQAKVSKIPKTKKTKTDTPSQPENSSVFDFLNKMDVGNYTAAGKSQAISGRNQTASSQPVNSSLQKIVDYRKNIMNSKSLF